MRRTAPILGFLLLATPVAADTFGGFSGVDRPYLVNQDRVCTPLKVTGTSASGAPSCEKQGADVVAKLGMKAPVVQSGPKAMFAATAAGKTLTVARKATNTPVVIWNATDSIGKIVEVYGSQYDDRVAVAFTEKRLGKEVTSIVAFDLLGTAKDPVPTTATTPTTPTTSTPENPAVTKAVAAARKAPKGAKQLAAWKAVLAADAQHTEAMYRIAAAQIAAKQAADAIASMTTLAASTRADAIEWLIEARYDPAFASVRADPKFRVAVGLDPAAKHVKTPYERFMGFGGQWEQTGTSCDKAEVRLVANRDRTFKLRVKTRCQGSVMDLPFKGSWRAEPTRIVLTLPTKGKQVTAADEAPCVFEPMGDEDALRCQLDDDLEFVVLPTRR